MAEDLYELIRRRAYEIWENDGRPEGAAHLHWEQATDELAGDDEHETLQDLIDEDDREDEAHRGAEGASPAPPVDITTGEGEGSSAVRSVEGP